MNHYSVGLLVCVALIFALGLVMIFGTSSAEVLNLSLDRSLYQALFKQLIYAVLGVGFTAFLWYIGYRDLLRLSLPLLCFFSFLLVLVFVPGIGVGRNGAHRWIGFSGYTFQPSEFVKFLIPMYYISAILKYKKKNIPLKAFLKIVGVCLVPMFLILIEPDNGSAAVIFVILLSLFFITRVRLTYWAWPLLVVMVICGLLAFQLPYVRGRMDVYFNPGADLLGRGHQPYQAKIAVGAGQVFGCGVGHSLQKFNYLPEAQNDYIVAIYAEEFGFMGVAALIILYMLITYFGFHIAYKAKSKEGFYLSLALMFVVVVQAFLNLGVVSGLLPSTGMNLPFFSQGGTSLMANIVCIGVLLDIAR